MKASFLRFGRDNDRRRIAWVQAQLEALPAGTRILDAGAGEQRNRAFCGKLDYVSQDFCQYEGAGDGAALQTGRWDTARIDVVSDIVDIPLPTASFDAVICTEVLEHVPDAARALGELVRVLKPGGRLIVTAPFCSLTHFAPFHFASGFSRYWYEHQLKALGCRVHSIEANGRWPDYIAQELWRLPWIGQRYTSRALGWLALIAALPALAALRLMATNDRGSEELLCYGWQVVAQKNALASDA